MGVHSDTTKPKIELDPLVQKKKKKRIPGTLQCWLLIFPENPKYIWDFFGGDIGFLINPRHLWDAGVISPLLFLDLIYTLEYWFVLAPY